MNGYLGPLFAHHHDEAGVGHDDAIRLHCNHGFDVAHIGANLVVVRQQVAGDEKLLSSLVSFSDANANLF